jgi:Uncharacterized protein conserved in bacteria
MIDALFTAFGHFDLTVMLFLMIGVIAGTIVGIIPGLGGLFLLALLLPFTYGMDMFSAFALLMAAAAVTGTSNTVTAVLFGVPGTAGGVAVIFDGHPLAKKGRANEAMAASFLSSSLAAIFGVVVIAILLPVLRPVVLWFGPPEFFMLVLAAVVLMAYAVNGDKLKALMSGGLGLLVSFIGLEGSTGTPRYTFDLLYLWDGLKIVPVIIGLFAVTEMLILMRTGTQLSDKSALMSREEGGTRRGMIGALKHWRTMLQSSIIGVWVGLLPGVGGETSQFISYTQAQRTSKRGKYFGTGEVEGVIAADASTNSKDAGSLIPTLLFGIPGSAQMALLLAAFLIFGVEPGPRMLGDQLDVTWFLLLTLVVSHVAATLICLTMSRWFAGLAKVKTVYLVGAILVISLFGTYTTSNNIGDIWVAIIAGIVGYFMFKTGMSRATFIIGLVLGPLLEHNLILTEQIHGWTYLGRPIVIVLLAAIVLVMVWPTIKAVRGKRRSLAAALSDETLSPTATPSK